jgi:hypothetical protein
MRNKSIFSPLVLFILTVAWTGVVFAEYQHSPDPLIFDGSQLPPEEQSTSSLAKIIQKRPRMGIPGQFNSEGKQQQSQGIEGKEGPKHQKGESQEGGEGEEGEGKGDQAGKEGKEGEEGGELAEVDEEALAESEEMEGMGAGGEESQEGEEGGMSSAESMEGGTGKMGESSGRPILSKIEIGAPGEMIDVVEMENGASEGMDTNAKATSPKKPMVGKNKGQSLGMEEGDRIPSDI